MRTYKAVFSDIDGTLLTSEHIVSTATIEAIASLQKKNIPFVIISSRSASCIYPILKKHHFQCPIVACGGAWIEDMNGLPFFKIDIRLALYFHRDIPGQPCRMSIRLNPFSFHHHFALFGKHLNNSRAIGMFRTHG